MIRALRAVLVAMRPEQWVKNVFLFAGLVFSGNLTHPVVVYRVCSGFFIFCLAASSIYLLNDIFDLERDRHHPEKRHRPLAAGKLRPIEAWTAALLLGAVALALALYLDRAFLFILLLYLGINLVYSAWLKQLVILDVMCLSSGFVLRVLAGTRLAGVRPSDWLIICTITLALFLGFSKRRHELVLLENSPESHRRVLADYSLPFLDQMISVATASTVMAYALYTVAPQTVIRFGTRNLVFTLPFVLYGIYRYLYLIHQKKMGGNPAQVLLRDIPMLINAVLWVAAVLFIIY